MKSAKLISCFFGASFHSRKAFAIPRSFIALSRSIVCSSNIFVSS